ncbi:MAG: DUF484 family protein [Cellvibrionaceae bacterium]
MTDTQKKNLINSKDVKHFLQNHPDFFEEHPDLIADISLPHDSGSAVSLVEKQVAILRERNIDMRHRLSKLLENAKDNDKLFDKTRRLILMLLEGKTLPDLVNSIYFSFERDFKIPYTSFIFLGDTNKLTGTLGDSKGKAASLTSARENIGRIIGSGKAVCGDLPKNEIAFLFPDHASEIGSAAVVPLVHGNCFGLLAVGNSDPQYYRSSMGTLFLSYIGEALNRLTPQYLPN